MINQPQDSFELGPAATPAYANTKVIKRYANRKLYDTKQSRYITHDDIAKMIRANEELKVVDNRTKNDITAGTLTQIIFSAEQKAAQYPSLFTLREIIQNGNGSISSYLAKLGVFPVDHAKVEASQSVDDLNQTLDNRVAKAALDNPETATAASFIDEHIACLPNSNRSLNL